MNYRNAYTFTENIHLEEDEINNMLKSFVIKKRLESTSIIAVVVDKESPSNNAVKTIPCDGEPIHPCAYDVSNDCFYFSCVYYLSLGKIPTSYVLDKNENSIYLNVPEIIFEKHLDDGQYKSFVRLKETYGDKNKFEIKYLQSIVS